ncbi:putative het domain-containing protein [Neofusicoccum parvum UCRNP2]|uniref:Putative het domain-containing protein n=1 Tax=Botryosphaeria parva (strain UCR-NP2) TaxID=1287680 RepID=R1G7H2_BOTPV|nr:putative het domain-containing protein [Neofusicoccum parvum UCRNP2]
MRLLNTQTRKLASFSDLSIPPYAILSHRWQDEEAVFEDFHDEPPTLKAGYRKIELACKQAAQDGLEYVWIDTCCIDKSSSAELSESINSMYAWYRKADVCYAYLADVPDQTDAYKNRAFADSDWFTRGWTLQELIAPMNMVFYSRGWVELGHKVGLRKQLSRITGIDVGVLAGIEDPQTLSVAKRMSWAARRATSRVEDIAYCLMGLFDVNMPMIYGEGEKAFIRLQEEIMKDSDDESLFAWVDKTAPPDALHGLLARDPACFADSGNIVPYYGFEDPEPFVKTNRGLRISLPLSMSRVQRKDDRGFWIATLRCRRPWKHGRLLGVGLNIFGEGASRDHTFPNMQQCSRVRTDMLFTTRIGDPIRTLYFRQNVSVLEGVYVEQMLVVRTDPTPYDLDSAFCEVAKVRRIIGKHYASEQDLISPNVSLQWARTERRGAVWRDIKVIFRFPKAGNKLAGAVVFSRRVDNTKFAVLLGSARGDVGVDAIPQWTSGTDFTDLQKVFNPKATGRDMYLGKEIVRVDVTTNVHLGRRYHVVDIDVEESPTDRVEF